MIGYIAGALTTIAFAPQLLKALNYKIHKRRIPYDVALFYFRHDPLAISWNSG